MNPAFYSRATERKGFHAGESFGNQRETSLFLTLWSLVTGDICHRFKGHGKYMLVYKWLVCARQSIPIPCAGWMA